MNQVIIAISGRAQNGKDTCADLMTELLGENECARATLARVVKEQATVLGWNGEKDEAGRTLLQNISEMVKTYHKNKNFYVDACYKDCLATDKKIVFITDVRYQNEIDFFKEKGAIILRVVRPESENWHSPLTLEQKNHISESGLDNYDFENVIINDDSLDDLKEKLKEFLVSKNILKK